MPVGNPLLAVWNSAAELRSYEYSDGVFVQVGLLSSFPHLADSGQVASGAYPYPNFAWDWDDNFLIASRINEEGQRVAVTLNPQLQTVAAESTLNTSTTPAAVNGGFGFNAAFHEIYFHGLASESGIRTQHISNTGARSYIQASATSTAYTSEIEVSPNGQFLFYALSTGAPQAADIKIRSRTDDNSFVDLDVPALTLKPHMIRAIANNRGVIFIDKNANAAKVYARLDGEFQFMHDLELPAGVPAAAAASQDGQWLVISCVQGSTYISRVFQRKGDFFAFYTDIASFGKLLSFSADSLLLVDAGLRKARKLDGGVFNNADAAMVNLPELVVAQALSRGRAGPTGNGWLYNAAVQPLAEATIDLDDLKLTLLGASAAFDPTDTTISEVTSGGANEVAGGDWPAGGLPLTNVTAGITAAGIYDLRADPIAHMVMSSSLSARFAVIYIASSGIPLVNIDFQTLRTIPAGREALFTFIDDGAFLRYQN